MSLDRRLELLEQPARTAARAGTVLAGAALATPMLYTLEVWFGLVEHARRGYSPADARKIIRVESTVISRSSHPSARS